MPIEAESHNIPYDEDYFRRKGRQSSYTEEYWQGSERVTRYFVKRLNIIRDRIMRSKVIIDIGCGPGHSSRVLRLLNPGSYVVGIDISEAAIKRAREISAADHDLDFIVGSATELPIRSNSIDLAVGMFIYEHLEAPIRMLREIHRVLREGGTVFMTTDNVRSIGAIIRRDKWVGLRDETHVSLTSPEQIKLNIFRTGFNGVRCITHGFPILNTFEKLIDRILDAPLGLGAEIIIIAEKPLR